MAVVQVRSLTYLVTVEPAVVKFQDTLDARELPPRSFTPEVPPMTVAVYWTPGNRAALGCKVALRAASSYVTTPAISAVVPCLTSLNVVVVTVEAFIGSENVTVTGVFVATLVAFTAGDLAVTVGRVVSPTVKLHAELDASGFPATSLTPDAPPITVAV